MLLSIAEKEKTKDAWETLKTMYLGADRVRTAKVQTLKAEFEVLKMKETETVDEFSMKVNNVVSNIRALGDKVEEGYVVKKLHRAVPTKFLQIASTIEQFGDLETMTVEDVVGRLKTYEERVKGHEDNEEQWLLLTHEEWLERSKQRGDDSKSPQKNHGSDDYSSRGRGRGRGRGGSRGGHRGGDTHNYRDGGQGSSGSRDKSKIKCFNCNEYGHYAYDCPEPKQDRNQEANLVQAHEDEEHALL